jgi:methyl-accepting chemotaxis protein
VNSAVNQMDQVTQQNAAMVEQSTAASHSLAGEATKLSKLVGQFKLGQSAPAPVHAMPARKPMISKADRKPVAEFKPRLVANAAAAAPADAGGQSWDEF